MEREELFLFIKYLRILIPLSRAQFFFFLNFKNVLSLLGISQHGLSFHVKVDPFIFISQHSSVQYFNPPRRFSSVGLKPLWGTQVLHSAIDTKKDTFKEKALEV